MTFEEFLAIELGSLSRYARALAGDRDLAHDVLAEALIGAQLRWARIGVMDRPGGYVRSMVTNGFLSHGRSWTARFVKVTGSGRLPEQAAPAGDRSVDDRDQLDRLLRMLPRQQRAAIVCRYYLGLADADIAVEMGCTESTVRSNISRGLATVRAQQAADDEPPPPSGDRPRDTAPPNLHVIGEH